MKMGVVIIDMQQALFATPPDEAGTVVSRVNELAARARQAGVPVIWVQHVAEAYMPADSDGWRLVSELIEAPQDLHVNKTTPDAFHGTALRQELELRQIKHLAICGYASEFCVDTTVRRAAALGYAVTLAADAHTTHDKPHASARDIRTHENATLPEITSFGAPIRAITAEQISFS